MGYSSPGWPGGGDGAPGPQHSLFPAAVGLEGAVRHPVWQAAWHEVLEAIQRPGVVLLLGDPGTGKTLFLHALQAELADAGRIVVLAAAHQVEAQGYAAAGKPDVLLIDDADRLPGTLLRASALAAGSVILAGGTGLREIARGWPGPTVSQAVLGPLLPAMVPGFLSSQLRSAGAPPDLFEPEAVAALARCSNGVPRLLQVLAGLSVFVARLDDAPRVLPSHVAQGAFVRTGTELDDTGSDGVDADLPIPAAAAATPATVAPGGTAARRNAAATRFGWACLVVLPAALAIGVWSTREPLGQLASDPEPSEQGRPEAPSVAPEAAPAPPTPPARLPVPVQVVDLGPSPPAAEPDEVVFSVFGSEPAVTPVPASPEVTPAPEAEASPPVPGPGAAALAGMAVVPPDTELASLPAAIPPRVVVLAARDPAAEFQGLAVLRALHAASIPATLQPLAALPRSDPGRTTPAINFFYAEDGAAAAMVARQADLATRERLVRATGPLPEPGSIQVVIPAAPAARAVRTIR